MGKHEGFAHVQVGEDEEGGRLLVVGINKEWLRRLRQREVLSGPEIAVFYHPTDWRTEMPYRQKWDKSRLYVGFGADEMRALRTDGFVRYSLGETLEVYKYPFTDILILVGKEESDITQKVQALFRKVDEAPKAE